MSTGYFCPNCSHELETDGTFHCPNCDFELGVGDLVPSEQRYISKELFHFVGRSEKTGKREEYEDRQYHRLLNILRLQRIGLKNPEDVILRSEYLSRVPQRTSGEYFKSDAVCFCDIPLENLAIHVSKYSRFGLSFTKEFVFSRLGAPMFYLPADMDIQGVPFYDEMIYEYRALMTDVKNKLSQNKIPEDSQLLTRLGDLERNLDEFIFSHLKLFYAHHLDTHPENYYFEREWRVLGSLQFTLNDVVRILLPKDFSKYLRSDFVEYRGQVTLL